MNVLDWLDDVDRRDWARATEGTVRFALIGLGWWTVDISIPAIEASERCETTVLVSGSTEKAQRLADQHGVEHGISYDAFHDGQAADAYDAIYIGTPNAYHAEFAATAARLEKAILCEKPIEANVERAESMVATAEDAGVPFMGAYRMQTDPLTRRAKELLEAGVVGEPVFVYGTNSQPLLQMIPDPNQWRLNADLSGYGTSVMDLGIYVINTTRFLLDRDPISARAEMGTSHEAFEDVPDQWASFELLLEGGLPLLGTTSQHAEAHTCLSITGTDGRIELDPAFHGEVRLRLVRDGVDVVAEDPDVDATREMTEEFDYFADRVLTGEPIEPDGQHALVDMRTIRAIHEAAETGELVSID